jgi:hypothetical protein
MLVQMMCYNDNVADEDLKIALDTRKFEIELYWNRSQYFWGFCTVFLSAIVISDKTIYKILELGENNDIHE